MSLHKPNLMTLNKLIVLLFSVFVLPILLAILSGKQLEIHNYSQIYLSILILCYLIYQYLYKINIFDEQFTIYKSTVITAFILYFTGALYSSASKYYAFCMNAYDFGLFYDMVDGLANGNLGFTRCGNFYHFVVHQNYILLLVALIYKFIKTPFVFFILHAGLVTLNGMLLYKLANLKLNKLISILIAISYLSSSFICYSTNFRPEYFLPTFILFCYYSFLNRKYTYFLISAILCALVKEEAILYLFGFAVYLLINKSYKYALILIIISICIAIINTMITVPFFLNINDYNTVPTMRYFTQWGVSKTDMVVNLLTHPLQILSGVFGSKSGIWRLYLPMLFIPVFDLYAICTSMFSIFLHAIVTPDSEMHRYQGYYSLTLAVIAYVGAINIIVKINNYKIKVIATLVIILSCLFESDFQNYYPINIANYNSFKQATHSIENVDQKIIISNNLFPHLVDRKNIQVELDINKIEKSYYFLYPVGDLWPYHSNEIKEFIKKLHNCSNWGDFYVCDNR